MVLFWIKFLIIIIGGVWLFSAFAPKQIKIEEFIWIQTFCYASTLIIGLSLLIKHIERPYLQWDFDFGVSVIKKSWPFIAFFLVRFCRALTSTLR